ncbi:MAG TPA: stage III sporulation protein AE [Erysipelotrichaceae bacterium]|nr:stage III sporulation protein AE [Bacillota bacterium]HPW54025.1 stage III sporulation protein AE [Erysipelotrichaceae bacterium]
MDYRNIINEQLESMNLEALEELAGRGNMLFLNDLSVSEIISRLIEGKPLFNFDSITESIINLFFKEFSSSVSLGIQIIAVCIIMALMTHLCSAFGSSAASSIGMMVCSCTVVAMCLFNFRDIYSLCENSVTNMATFMQVLIPVLLPLILSMGGFSSGGILSPAIISSVTIFTTLIQKIILPLLFFSCIFILGNSLADRDYVKKLAVLLRSAAGFIIGFSVTLFSGLTAIQSLVTKSADGMLIKTAKFSVDNLIPIVGSFAADSLDMVLSCTAIIKNSIGIFGLIVIILLLMFPLIQILCVALVYKITATLVEPIGNKVIADCLNEMGNTVIVLAVMLFLCAVLFIIFISILISIGIAL